MFPCPGQTSAWGNVEPSAKAVFPLPLPSKHGLGTNNPIGAGPSAAVSQKGTPEDYTHELRATMRY